MLFPYRRQRADRYSDFRAKGKPQRAAAFGKSRACSEDVIDKQYVTETIQPLWAINRKRPGDIGGLTLH